MPNLQRDDADRAEPAAAESDDGSGSGEDTERVRRRILWSMPSGLYLLGSAAGGRRNLMTLSWAVQVASDPVCVGVGVELGALSHRLVSEGGSFSVCLLRRADRAVVRRFAKPAVEDDGAPGTLSGEPVAQAPSGVPVLTGSLAWLDCALTDRLDFASHSLFVGRVHDWWASPDLGEGVLRMEDTRMHYGG